MKKMITSLLFLSLSFPQLACPSTLLPSIEQSENPANLLEQSFCLNGSFDLKQARRSLSQLKREIKEQYGIEIDVQQAIDQSIQAMIDTGKFTSSEIEIARDFYSQLTSPEARFAYRGKGKAQKAQEPQLVLPDKMALAFMSILGGSVLCILPFGITQGIGTGLIAGGIYGIATAVSEGERPYYIDPETGQPIVPNSGPSIGIGKDF